MDPTGSARAPPMSGMSSKASPKMMSARTPRGPGTSARLRRTPVGLRLSWSSKTAAGLAIGKEIRATPATSTKTGRTVRSTWWLGLCRSGLVAVSGCAGRLLGKTRSVSSASNSTRLAAARGSVFATTRRLSHSLRSKASNALCGLAASLDLNSPSFYTPSPKSIIPTSSAVTSPNMHAPVMACRRYLSPPPFECNRHTSPRVRSCILAVRL